MNIDDNFAETILKNANLPVVRIGSERKYVSMDELVKFSLRNKLPEGEFRLVIYVEDRFGKKYYSSSIIKKI